MMETGLSMCCQMRLSGNALLDQIVLYINRLQISLISISFSEMLRRSAEHTMVVMIQTMFQRYVLKQASEERKS